MFCCSAGLLIDLELAGEIRSGRFPLLAEWSVELEQQWGRRREEAPLVLLAAGLRWQPGAGSRDPERPCCCPLPPELRQLVEQLAQALQVRLIEVETPPEGLGLGRGDLLEAPLLLVASGRPPQRLLSGWLSAEQPGQGLSIWSLDAASGQLQRLRHRGLRQLGEAELERGLPSPLEPLQRLGQQLQQSGEPGPGAARVFGPALLALPAALVVGLAIWQWRGRIGAGLLLIAAAWWWLSRRPALPERNRHWCLGQLLQLQRLWADFAVRERVRDLLHDGRQPLNGQPGLLLQMLQAHRLALELQRRNASPWRRADLVDALTLFSDLHRQLQQAERQWRRQQGLLLLGAAVLACGLLLAIALGSGWADALLLPMAAVLALLSLLRPIPLLPASRCRRAVLALEGPLAVLRQAQRSDDLVEESGLRREVELAIVAAGRELVDLVNDSLSSQAIPSP